MTPRQVALAEACYANDFGCSLKELGLREMIVENAGWDYGETYLLPDMLMGEFVKRRVRLIMLRRRARRCACPRPGVAGPCGATARAAQQMPP